MYSASEQIMSHATEANYDPSMKGTKMTDFAHLKMAPPKAVAELLKKVLLVTADVLQPPRNNAAPFSPTLLPKRSCAKLEALTA